MYIILEFVLFTFVVYWIHRLAHIIPYIGYFHNDHHKMVNKQQLWGWHWSNFFLFNDSWKSTADLWITEVIPLIILSFIFNSWYLFGIYYVWAAIFQERIEHNGNFDMKYITSGKWHLFHHKQPKYNFGIFFPVWDMIFGTYKHV
jgi:lathosterol oxidase